MLSNKLKNTREVTFQADYKSKKGTVIYAKGTTHYIHFKTVEKLKNNKAKFTAKEFDADKLKKAKDKLKKAK